MVDGFLLDLDGTLYVGDEALPGALEAVRTLSERGIPRRFLTNTTRLSRRELAQRLRRMGFEIEEDEVFTAPRAAAAWMDRVGIRSVSLLVPSATLEDFQAFDSTATEPEALVVGDLGEGWNFDVLNAAFRQLLGGARLVALQKNRYWKRGDGLALDAGPFVAALEYAAATEAVVVGKPAPEFFHLAAGSMGVSPDRVTVVGDDLESDVGGAQSAGMRGVLVRTGKFREEVLRGSSIRPHAVVDTLRSALGVS